MTAPPRMLYLSGGGYEALVLLPTSYDKAVQIATEKFGVNKATHDVRLTCKAAEMPWIGSWAATEDIYIADTDAYHYACAGKQVVRLGVLVVDKNAGKAATPAPAPAPAPGAGGAGAGAGKAAGGGGSAAAGGGGGAKGGGAGAASKEAELTVSYDVKGKITTFGATVSGDLAKGPPAGSYLGTLTVEGGSFKEKFVGKQLGPNEVFAKFIAHDQATARLLFRPRSVRPKVDILYPEETSLEVSYHVADWQVLTAYPMTSLVPDEGKTRLRWFLRVKQGGSVEDLMTGTESSGLFVEFLPSPKAKPADPKPDDPLIPAWPDVRPQNGYCLPRDIFIPHIDRILTTLGIPVESRTSMITAWLPSLMRHKNIAYRLLSSAQLEPTLSLTIIPPPQVLIRVFVLFTGVPDGELKEWESKGLLHAEMGLDWKDAIGWDKNVGNEEMFRVIEYGFMEVNI
ncbi:hypothetical protein JCM24511_00144 [Saitozyma sp. JCM 24511]|nr:hypothetical protein JCM24511_00144 [Saitozyma sp. JCM 24511]